MLRPWPPIGGWTWAASPASRTRPRRYSAAWRATSVNREIHIARRSPKSVPYTATSAARSSSIVGSRPVVDPALVEHEPDRLVGLASTDGVLADAVAPEAELGLLVHLDLGEDPAHRRIGAGEVDPRRLAHEAAPAVAAHDVARPQRRAVAERDVDAIVVLRQPDDLAATQHRHAELGDPLTHDPLDVALPQGQPVRVARREVAEVERDLAVPDDLHHLAGGEEPLGDAALVEDLDRAGVQAAGRELSSSWLVRRSTTTASTPANAARPPAPSPSDHRRRSRPHAPASRRRSRSPPCAPLCR